MPQSGLDFDDISPAARQHAGSKEVPQGMEAERLDFSGFAQPVQHITNGRLKPGIRPTCERIEQNVFGIAFDLLALQFLSNALQGRRQWHLAFLATAAVALSGPQRQGLSLKVNVLPGQGGRKRLKF